MAPIPSHQKELSRTRLYTFSLVLLRRNWGSSGEIAERQSSYLMLASPTKSKELTGPRDQQNRNRLIHVTIP